MNTPSFVVALIEKDGLILAVSRRNKPDDLGLPGDSIEPGETAYNALVREVKEETGVEVRAAHHFFSRIDETTDGKVAWTYTVVDWVGQPRQREEGITVQWVKPERLLEDACTFREYNRHMLQKLEQLRMLVSMSDEEWEKRPKLTNEEIKRSLEAGIEARREADEDTPAVRITPGLRFK